MSIMNKNLSIFCTFSTFSTQNTFQLNVFLNKFLTFHRLFLFDRHGRPKVERTVVCGDSEDGFSTIKSGSWKLFYKECWHKMTAPLDWVIISRIWSRLDHTGLEYVSGPYRLPDLYFCKWSRFRDPFFTTMKDYLVLRISVSSTLGVGLKEMYRKAKMLKLLLVLCSSASWKILFL